MTLGPSREKFAFVCHEHRDMLLKYARRLVSEADAQDLVQQTITSCLEYSVTKPPPEHLDHWLMKVLVNNLNSAHRRTDVRKRAENDPALVPHPPDEIQHSIYEEVTVEDLAAAVERLRPKLRVAYRHHMEGLSNSEVAAKLQLRPNAVAKRLHDARRVLRKLLAPGTQGDES